MVHLYQDRFGNYLQTIDTHIKGSLPVFSKPMGFDFIITPENRVILIELQHGFGRKGLLELFPMSNKIYRRTVKRLLKDFGNSTFLSNGLRKICKDKIITHNLFSDYQPSGITYNGWSDRVASWLERSRSEYILLKPPRLSCGKGIRVYKRLNFIKDKPSIPISHTYLLQEYIKSKILPDRFNRPHLGCIRHIAILYSDSEKLSFIHLPSYWRVSPSPFETNPKRDAFTANISNGAYPEKLSEQDINLVQRKTEEIGRHLITKVLQIPDIKLGHTGMITASGEILNAEITDRCEN